MGLAFQSELINQCNILKEEKGEKTSISYINFKPEFSKVLITK